MAFKSLYVFNFVFKITKIKEHSIGNYYESNKYPKNRKKFPKVLYELVFFVDNHFILPHFLNGCSINK